MSLTFTELHSLWVKAKLSQKWSTCLVVDSGAQAMIFFENEKIVASYIVSTAKNGLGCQQDSYQTPSGFLKIDEKIGTGQPLNMLFKARHSTGHCAEINSPKSSKEDSISSRILWLSGLQEGINLSGDVDTKRRYIYMHGTADEKHLGTAVSHGCIRMKNTDIVELFEKVDAHTLVYIY